MSAPRLALWKDFVQHLEEEACLPPLSDEDARRISFDVRAGRACAKIRNSYGRACFLDSIGRALVGVSQGVPQQTTNLAAIRWPLVVSTNYDDLYLGSCRCSRQAEGEQASASEIEVQVMGRSAEDCKAVLSALHGPFDRQYIWHVQGFLGGQFGNGIEDAVANLDALRGELVVGHAEYRVVTNASPHFRRCFGEMFSSRSFLFLGSSLSEEYFLNLFGEVLELRGPSTVPHFAFIKRGAVDANFLADQMNITVCEFDQYEDLAIWLQRLKTAIEHPEARNESWSFTVGPIAGSRSDLEIVRSEVSSRPSADSAIALVARRDKNTNRPILDGAHAIWDLKYPSLSFIKNHVVKYGDENLYAVTARCRGDEDDTAVAEAMFELFDEVNSNSKDYEDHPSIHLQLSSTGGTVPPVYAFMEAARSFGQWKRENPTSHLRLITHITPDVSLSLTSERIDVQELLSSELIRFWAVVLLDRDQEPIRRTLYYKKESSVQEVLDDLGIPSSQAVAEWCVSICPSSRREALKRPTWSLRDQTIHSIGVVFGSVVTLECSGATHCLGSSASVH